MLSTVRAPLKGIPELSSTIVATPIAEVVPVFVAVSVRVSFGSVTPSAASAILTNKVPSFESLTKPVELAL